MNSFCIWQIWLFISTKSAGVKVKDAAQDAERYRITVIARLEKTLPISPGRRMIGTKIMIVVKVEPITAEAQFE